MEGSLTAAASTPSTIGTPSTVGTPQSPSSDPLSMVSVKGNGVQLSYKVTKKKNIGDAYLLCLVFGVLGAHRFYLGNRFFGVMYLCTLGLFFSGWITDLCKIPVLVKRANLKIQKKCDIRSCDKIYLDEAYTMWLPFGILGKLPYSP